MRPHVPTRYAMSALRRDYMRHGSSNSELDRLDRLIRDQAPLKRHPAVSSQDALKTNHSASACSMTTLPCDVTALASDLFTIV